MNKIFISLMVLSILIFSCDDNIEISNFTIGDEENFVFGTEYLANNNSLKFKITEINDSRCPSDVVCIWEGKADVKIEVEKPVQGTIELSTWQNKVDTIGSFSFELIDVSPYPVSTKKLNVEDYTLKIKILNIND